ncbi:MAG: hypothetical protein DRJ49_07115 [Thermoprotei archaeon]|nr:MAG: hypothetical protein DRJ49_07115 [Thermoprotei archaeon]
MLKLNLNTKINISKERVESRVILMMGRVLLVTTPEVPGYRVKRVVGIVTASTIRTRGMLGRIISGIEALVGGRGRAYLEELNKARREVLDELERKARMMGANAVIGIDFETTEMLEGFIMITAYGTAVEIEPLEK